MGETTQSSGQLYTVTCSCGNCEYTAQGPPLAEIYCHCNDCRRAYQGLVLAGVGFAEGAVTLTKGHDCVTLYKKTPDMERRFCKVCGFKLYNHQLKMGTWGMPAVDLVLAGHTFKPVMHIFCKEALPGALEAYKDDGLPKYVDIPEAFGGSGKTL
jgi:hypothetical protein